MEVIEIKNNHNKLCIGKCRNCGSTFSEFQLNLEAYSDYQGVGICDTTCSYCKVGRVGWAVKKEGK